MHELASCFCPYQLYPHDTLCTYGVKQLKLLGFSQRHLFGCSLMVDLKRLRTLDLSDANRTLSQLSYRPIFMNFLRVNRVAPT